MNYKSLFNQANFDGNLAIVDNLTVRDSLDISGATVSGAVTVWPELTIALDAKQDIITCTVPMQILSDTVSLNYSTANFKITNPNLLDTIQGIRSIDSPTFNGLTLSTLAGIAIANYLSSGDAVSKWGALVSALALKQNLISCTLPISISGDTISLGYSANLKLTNNQLDTIQGIRTVDSPTFNNLSLTTLQAYPISTYLRASSISATAPLTYDSNTGVFALSYSPVNFSNSGGILNTTQGIRTVDSPTFNNLSLTTLQTYPISTYLRATSISATVPMTYDSNTGVIALSYNSTNLKLTTNQLNTIQDITTTSSPTFANVNLGATGKLDFSNFTTASTVTPSHIDLWGATYGLSILASTLGYLVPVNSSHFFYVNGTSRFEVSGSGAAVVGNLALTSLNSVSIGNYLLTTDATTKWSNLTTALSGKQNTVTCNPPLSIDPNSLVSISYNSTNLKLTTNSLNTIQNITTTSSPTFSGLTLTTLNNVAIGDYLLSGDITGTYPVDVVNDVVTLKYSATNLKKNAINELDTIQNISTVSSPTFAGLSGVGYSIIYNNVTTPTWASVTAATQSMKLVRLWTINGASSYYIRITMTMTAAVSSTSCYIPEFTNKGLSSSSMTIFDGSGSGFVGHCIMYKYTPDFDGLTIIKVIDGLPLIPGSTYKIAGQITTVADFD